MISIGYKNKDWKKRVLTYHDENSNLEEVWFDLKQIIKQGAIDIKIN